MTKEELTEFGFLGYAFKAVYIKCRDEAMRYSFIALVSNTGTKNFMDKSKALGFIKGQGQNRHHRKDSEFTYKRMAELFWGI